MYLALPLILLVLIYIQLLRAMPSAIELWFTGQGEEFRGGRTGLSAVYGTGFIAMSLTMAGLFSDALRCGLDSDQIRAAKTERGVWMILAITGALSIAVSRTSYGASAAIVRGTLPISTGVFSAVCGAKGKIRSPLEAQGAH